MSDRPTGALPEARAGAPSALARAVARARHVARRVRAEGPAEPLRRFVYRHGLRRRLGVIVDPPLERYGGPAPPADMTGHRLTCGDLDDYLALRPDQTRAGIEGRLEAGHVGLVVRQGDRLVGHSWVGFGRVPVDDLACDLELAADAAFVYDDFVRSEARGRNTLRAVAELRREASATRGTRWQVAVLLPENELAFQRMARHRPVFVGEVVRMRLGPWSRLVLRVDRELAARRPLPVSFVGWDGRPATVREVTGPLLLGRSSWATPRGSPPTFPLSGALDRTGLLRRRLVTVFDADPHAGSRTLIPVEVAPLGPAAIAEYLTLRTDQTRAEIERRLAAGHACFVGRAYGEVVAACWLAPGGGAFTGLGCEVQLAPDAAGIHDAFVAPSLRRRRVLDPVARRCDEHALRQGWKRCVALVPPETPGAWVRERRLGHPVVAELRRHAGGEVTLRLERGVVRASLPCKFVADGREIRATTR